MIFRQFLPTAPIGASYLFGGHPVRQHGGNTIDRRHP